MHRLTEFFQNIVCNVNDIGNRIDANKRKSSSHPCGCSINLDVGNIMCNITRAEVGCFDGDMKGNITSVFGVGQIGHLERLFQYSRNFSCDTDDRLAVGTVCRDADIENIVIQPQNRLDIGAERCICGQNEQSVVAGTRIHVLGDTEFCSGAEHTVGFLSAELTLFDGHDTFDGDMVLCRCIDGCADHGNGESAADTDVVRAAADLLYAVFAKVYGTDMDMGIGNQLAGENFTDNNAGDVRADFLQFFYLKTGGEQKTFQFLCRNVNIDVFL